MSTEDDVKALKKKLQELERRILALEKPVPGMSQRDWAHAPVWMTPTQVASYLGMSLPTINRYISNGIIPSFQVPPVPGKTLQPSNRRCLKKAIDDWIERYTDYGSFCPPPTAGLGRTPAEVERIAAERAASKAAEEDRVLRQRAGRVKVQTESREKLMAQWAAEDAAKNE